MIKSINMLHKQEPKNNNKEVELEDEFSIATKDSFIERFGIIIIDFVGSWLFLIINIVAFALWLIFNLHYDWLTLWVSLEAIIITVLILIYATKTEKSDRQRAIKDYKIDILIVKKLRRMEERLKNIEEKLRR